MARFGEIEISDAEARKLSDAAIVERLVAHGKSRLTAARIVELARQKLEPSRARAHAQSRR